MNIVVFGPEEWGESLPGDDERAVHVREILKLLPGDRIKIGLLGKGLATADVERSDADGLVLRFPPADTLTAAPDPLPLHLLLGHPRPPVMQRLLKDLNAIGIAAISVCITELAEKSYFQSRLWSKGLWENFLIQGAQQGGTVHLAQIHKYWSLKKTLDEFEVSAVPEQARIVLDVACGSGVPQESLLTWAARYRAETDGPVYMAIGPERGWTDAERTLFAERGFKVLGLGKRVLRTETAAILACGVMSLAMQG